MIEQERVMVVTGGSRGIGAATAKLASLYGCKICVNYCTHEKEANKIVQAIKSSGGNGIAIKADTSKEGEVRRLFRTVDRKLGPLTALVNAAGISGGRLDFVKVNSKTLQKVFGINVFGYFLCAQEAAKRFSKKFGGKGGTIVNVSSQAAIFGGVRLTHYASSKAAVNTFTIGLARELAPEGIRVNAVSPGIIETPGMKEANWGGAPSLKQLREINRSIPLGRLGDAREVAEAIVWLSLESSSYVTGTILPVAGGR